MINAVVTDTSLKIYRPDTVEYSITFKDTNGECYSLHAIYEAPMLLRSLGNVMHAIGVKDFTKLKGTPCEIEIDKNGKIRDINNFMEKHGAHSDE